MVKILPFGKLKGYNSDYYGFKKSLQNFLPTHQTTTPCKALILGNGGAAQAVKVALEDMGIAYQVVSQKQTPTTIGYEAIASNLATHHLLINTTPLGMYPSVTTCPLIPYSLLTSNHYIFDLVYNPVRTVCMELAEKQGAFVKNGLEMLYFQAEKAWEIWNVIPHDARLATKK